MEAGQEWLTTRDLRLSLVERVELTDNERLTEDEIEALRQHMQDPCPRKTDQGLAARAQDCPDRIGESRVEGPDDGLGPGTASRLSQVHRQSA
jgi:hypothetical protein